MALLTEEERGVMDEWWKDHALRRALDKALVSAGWGGLSVGPFGVRIANAEDGGKTIRILCAENISCVRLDGNGYTVLMNSPAGSLEFIVRGYEAVFLPADGRELEGIRDQIRLFGDQLRQGLLGGPAQKIPEPPAR
jgi:hypothetical protein